jgi:Prophage tail length tape measure protein
MKGLGKAAGIGLGAAGAAGAVAVLKTGWDELAQSQKVAAQTAAVLKSTGQAAGITKGHVEGLSKALSQMSGVDDELIQSSQNVLLTFTKIGAKGGVFDDATKAALDMSVALGTDLQGATIQIGKALNDPIKGITALQRVGVSFTKSQKDQIKALVESGNVMGAQKLILRELQTEFGGSAKAAGDTLPGQLAKARNAFEEISGQLVAKLIPVMQQAIGWLRDHWPEIQAAVQNAWRSIQPLLAALGDLFMSIVDVIREHWPQIQPVVEGIGNVIRANMKVIGEVISLIAALLRGDWSEAWEHFKGIVTSAVELIRAVIITAFNAWKLVVTAVMAAVETLLTAGWNKIKAGIQAAVDGIKSTVVAGFDAVKGAVSSAIDLILTGISKLLGGIASMLEGAAKIPIIGGKFKGLADDVRGAQAKVDGLRGAINSLPTEKTITITTVLRTVGETVGGVGSAIAGQRQHGGPVKRGLAYLVGEKGPELFIPDIGGKIAAAVSGGTAMAPALAGGMPDRLYLDLGEGTLVELVRKGKNRFERLNGAGSW